jgi:hypothetical protein
LCKFRDPFFSWNDQLPSSRDWLFILTYLFEEITYD